MMVGVIPGITGKELCLGWLQNLTHPIGERWVRITEAKLSKPHTRTLPFLYWWVPSLFSCRQKLKSQRPALDSEQLESIARNNTSNAYKCNKCPQTFQSNVRLEKHLQCHGGKTFNNYKKVENLCSISFNSMGMICHRTLDFDIQLVC